MGDDQTLAVLLKDWRGKFMGRDDKLADVLAAPSPVGLGDIVRYDHMRGRWHIWNGVRWATDYTHTMYDMVRLKALEWMNSAESGDAILTGDDRKAILPLFDVGKKVGVLKSLAAREGIRMRGDEFDRDPYLVGFENGILDLRAGRFYDEPSPDLMVSRSVGVDWDPQASCPTFDWFLDDILGGDQELVAYLRRFTGYAMTGLQREQKFWMFIGRGSNGKGVLARTLDHVMGEYAHAPSETLYMRTRFGSAPSSAARPDLMKLQAARFTYMSEPPGNQFNEELLKAHTGEDSILARDLYGKSDQMAQFAPTHKIVFLTNDPPKTDDVGVSMRRRARAVWFEQDYSINPKTSLEEDLKAEKQGILNMMMIEALAYLSEGLPEPPAVTRWSDEYIAENDPLAKFLADCCVVARAERGPAGSLWNAYQEWCARTGTDPMSQTGFGLAMGRKFEKKRTPTGNVYAGVRAKNAAEMADDDPE